MHLDTKLNFPEHPADIMSNVNKTIGPVDTERKLNIHKTFRRRPGQYNAALAIAGVIKGCSGETLSRTRLKISSKMTLV